MKEILVDEGALVKPGQVLVRLDTVTLESQLAEANANVAGRAGEAGGRQGLHRQAEERDRAGRRSRSSAPGKLVAAGRRLAARAGRAHHEGRRPPRPPWPRREAMLQTALQQVEVARRPTRRRSRRASTTRRCGRRSRAGCSTAWPSRARCWRPGGKALTLVNLDDVYMEIFLPVGAGRAP